MNNYDKFKVKTILEKGDIGKRNELKISIFKNNAHEGIPGIVKVEHILELSRRTEVVKLIKPLSKSYTINWH